MIRGRDILDSDSASAPPICVINEAFADHFFAKRDPIGMRIASTGVEVGRKVWQVVGVARNARSQNLRGKVEPRYFVAMKQDLSSAKYPVFLIRTVTENAPVLEGVRQAFRRVDASLPIESAHSFEEQIAPLTAQDRTTTRLAVVFGVVALSLAAIGLYGVLSYGMTSRTGEIAVRIALGAQPGRVIWMILAETSHLVVIGVAAGGVMAYAASRLITSRLFGVAPQDPLTLASAATVLLFVAFCAAFLPALRASRLPPVAALRRE